MMTHIDVFGLTDLGKVRRSNQDQFLVAELAKSMRVRQTSLTLDDRTRLSGGKKAHILLVADGMGGRPAGGRASSLVVGTIIRYVLNVMPWFTRSDVELLRAVERCQSDIEADAAANPDRIGMGTTLTMAFVAWPKFTIVHVGDSRAYRVRYLEIQQLTHDHTIAQSMAERGVRVGPPWGHVMWNVVGGDSPDLKPEVTQGELVPGDALVLCTDGLTRHVSESQIARAASQASTAEAGARLLVDAAKQGGGKDNITVIVARFGAETGDETVRNRN